MKSSKIELINKITEGEIKFNQLELELELVLKALYEEFHLSPILGVEIEFYANLEIDIKILQKKLNIAIKKERGLFQYETDIGPSCNILELIQDIKNLKKRISIYGIDNQIEFSFDSKPLLNDFGSSMHIHLNFIEDQDVEKYANILCNYAKETIKYYILDSSRLDHNFMAPTHICYGGNNRTCLIRIPSSIPIRLEHRLADSNIDPIMPIYAIFASIYDGLKNSDKIKNYPKIYGNAFDSQYKLESLI